MVLFRGDIKCKSLQRRTSISVILPADNIHFLSDTEEIVPQPYKTLYLLHGLYGSDDIFLANTSIQKFAEDHGIAIVIPCGENSFYLDNKKAHAYYGEYVGQELLDITRNIFPLSDNREDTFIAGFSMGGYGAIRNGLKYSKNFSKIGMISAALITDEIVDYTDDDNVLWSNSFYKSCFGDLDKIKNSDKDPKYLIENTADIPDIFMACGVDDFLYDKNVEFYEFLESKDINAEFMQSPGEHTWDFCDRYVKEFIKRL
ncbi:S-formylglutathione hydrolase FrmB [Methanobrevibacter gottschalkii]|uniref:S-formylglutathione hydrolase FrmB n=2 Tax=Methanobrevibacter gottschalkii TaxID=190974 RepID=A0A3N5C1M8_9EURY|nr:MULTISPECIES: alpha/beta hydrolase-fold protein [Methanobrevibacter]MCQ2971543.1 acetyl esterase [archaeon]OEC95734.1 acetyl esterase [Methanobrevibacter sp. A27]RPF51895.1 S-formylglutathione hydrolase FrmB [Methanobrevibacter gottschalkii DSM 11977]SEL31881.1 S-formylglutathione hydrolase FrmB [Methanobrevibacter gottschalkii]